MSLILGLFDCELDCELPVLRRPERGWHWRTSAFLTDDVLPIVELVSLAIRYLGNMSNPHCFRGPRNLLA